MRTTRHIPSAVLVLGIIAFGGSLAETQELKRPVSEPAEVQGSLILETDPGSTISWDGQELGVVDESGRMEISGIPLGTYSIGVQKEGFEPSMKEASITPGVQTLSVSLSKRPHSVPADSSGPTETESTLPDPFAKQSTPYISIGFVAVLLAIAAGALFLGRRRQMERDEEVVLDSDGPKVFMAEPLGKRSAPGFYEDLRHRETVLESFEDRGHDRPKPKVIELPVADSRSVEDEG